MKKTLLILALCVFALSACDKKPKYQADAYICGEPPDEVTFYCTTGTGPPRNDCSAAQPGEFATKPGQC